MRSRTPASRRSCSRWRKEAGFDVKLLPLETTSAIERYLNGNFQMYIGNWSGRGDPDPTLYAFFSCEGGQNVNKYCNRDLEAVLNAGPLRADVAKRKALYEKATGIYLADFRRSRSITRTGSSRPAPAVEGLKIYPDGLLRLKGVKPAQ